MELKGKHLRAVLPVWALWVVCALAFFSLGSFVYLHAQVSHMHTR